VIVGYLLQIAREVSTDGSRETSGLQRRISRLVGSLQPDTLRRLLEMGGDAAQRRRFVLDASQGMTVDAVMGLVQAAASAEGETISNSLVRMLTKLASHATGEESTRSHAAHGAFREHVERLVGSWSLNDPNPTAYSAALSNLAHTQAAPASGSASARHECEPARIVSIALEIGASGDRVRHAIAAMLDAGQFGELLDQLDAAPDPRSVIARELWARIADRDPLRTLLASPRIDHRRDPPAGRADRRRGGDADPGCARGVSRRGSSGATHLVPRAGRAPRGADDRRPARSGAAGARARAARLLCEDRSSGAAPPRCASAASTRIQRCAARR
jgi:hypothetical protein